jgi:hypothetical protein
MDGFDGTDGMRIMGVTSANVVMVEDDLMDRLNWVDLRGGLMFFGGCLVGGFLNSPLSTQTSKSIIQGIF